MRISDWSSDVCSSDLPVVDVAVTLTDGQFHSVDSSDQAFRTAAGIAMSEGLPECAPVLLEPIRAVTFSVPHEYIAKVHAIVSARRGQILGLEARAGWPGRKSGVSGQRLCVRVESGVGRTTN